MGSLSEPCLAEVADLTVDPTSMQRVVAVVLKDDHRCKRRRVWAEIVNSASRLMVEMRFKVSTALGYCGYMRLKLRTALGLSG